MLNVILVTTTLAFGSHGISVEPYNSMDECMSVVKEAAFTALTEGKSVSLHSDYANIDVGKHACVKLNQ